MPRSLRLPRPGLLPVALTLFLTAALVSPAPPVLAQDGRAAPPKVGVAAAYSDEVIDEATFIGRGEAIDKVSLIARVSGFLQEIAVDNGANVAKGDLLFRIEPDSYQATLQSRQADLSRAEANLELTKVELARKQELFSRGSVPESELDVARANELVAEADVAAAKAAIRQAELDLGYAEIRAPFDGRLGRIETSIGDLVGPGTAPLATLVREAPIYVAFALSEKQLITVLERLDKTIDELDKAENSPAVFLELPNGTDLEETGTIAFAENRINPDTGTITLRARFDNARKLIVDGAFLTVRIQAPDAVTKVLAPVAAIQRDQRGAFVLVVGENQLVEQRYVQTGSQIGASVVIEDGLREGEAVIVEGLQRVRPGVAVEAVTAGQPGE